MTCTPQKIRFDDDAHWHALRAQDVTSTESAALFGLSPYLTEYELWHRKRDGSPALIPGDSRMKWGRRLETAIAQGVAEDLGVKIRRINVYMRHAEDIGMGASFDYEIIGGKIGRGLMEVKNVDRAVYARAWTNDEAPPHIEVQMQHQMEVADLSWALIAALVGGNEVHVIERRRNRDVGANLRKKITAFWASVREGRVPNPDYRQDAAYVVSRHQQAGDQTLDADGVLDALLVQYAAAVNQAHVADDEKTALKARILDMVGDDYSRVLGTSCTLSCGMSTGTSPTIVTQEMVGTEIGGRRPYRTFILRERA